MASIKDPMPLWERFWANPTTENQTAVAEHYVAVAYVISGDFGKKYRRHPKEFWGTAWMALFGRVPHWKLGDAPFANYAAVRVRGAIMDSIGAHGWKRHEGGEDVCHARDEGYIPSASDHGRITIEDRENLARLIKGSDVSLASQVVYLRLQLGGMTIDQLAAEMNRPPGWIAARKRDVVNALAERVRDREHAAELLSAG